MAETVKNTRILLRRGKKAIWEAVNPILRAGEAGFEIDTYKLKIGDGEKRWNDLPYIAGGSYEISLDGNSVEFNSSNQVQIAGFDTAESGYVPSKNDDGGITWVLPSGDLPLPEEEIIEITG